MYSLATSIIATISDIIIILIGLFSLWLINQDGKKNRELVSFLRGQEQRHKMAMEHYKKTGIYYYEITDGIMLNDILKSPLEVLLEKLKQKISKWKEKIFLTKPEDRFWNFDS